MHQDPLLVCIVVPLDYNTDIIVRGFMNGQWINNATFLLWYCVQWFSHKCHCLLIWCETLTHWGRLAICTSNVTIIASNKGLAPGRRQAIIWTNKDLLDLGTYFIEILSESRAFSFKKMHLKMSTAKWQQFCLGFDVLTILVVSGTDDGCWCIMTVTRNWLHKDATAWKPFPHYRPYVRRMMSSFDIFISAWRRY